MQRKKIAVIGAGVIGLSIARSLALKGAEVTLLDANRVGTGTSSTTYAWVNSNGKSPLAYHQLNLDGMSAHRQLQEQSTSQGRWLDESGTVEWAVTPTKIERLEQRVATLKAKEYPVHLADRHALAEAIPELILPGAATAIWTFPSESVLCPSLFIAFLRAEAVRLCVSILERQAVTAVDEHSWGVRLHLNDEQSWEGDIAISATGRWTSALLAKMGVELAMVDADKPGRIGCSFLGYTSPAAVQLRSNLITPNINIRPDGGGRLLLQVPDLDHSADPQAPPPPDGVVAQEMLRRLAEVMLNVDSVEVHRIAVGQRARPADGLPAIGFVTDRKRLYVATTHSGMTLAPAIGPLVADEVLTGSRSALLTEFGPERLLGKSATQFGAIETIHFPAQQ